MENYIGIGKSDNLKTAINEATKAVNDPQVIFIFVEASKFKEATLVVNEMYPSTTVIGASTYGFAQSNVITDNIIIWAMGNGVEVESGVLNNATTFPVKHIKRLEESIKKDKSR